MGGEGRLELVKGRLEVHSGMPRRWRQHIIKLLVRYFDLLGFYALSEVGAVTKAEEYARAGLANYWIVGELPLRPDDGIVARYTNQGGAFHRQDTVLISELLAQGH